MNILKIAKILNIKKSQLFCYGNQMAKIIEPLKITGKEDNLILVTSINPTSSGEGKTTIAITLADALSKLKKKTCLALREPSLGPVFGAKGGATGNGEYCLVPHNKINLHFTGDMHAVTSANNLLCAMVDNHIFQGNSLNIDTNKICVHRCIDINDRALREITINYKNKPNLSRKEQFYLTSASEMMSILCLSKDFSDLKERIGNIIIAYNTKNKPVYAKNLMAENAVSCLLSDAINPNLVCTKNSTPAIVHGGPFANLSIGCNSFIALNTALNLSNYVVTEAGFGADLGAQKFLDIMCKNNNLQPKCVVIVATIKALLEHGEGDLKVGFENLKRHYNNLTKLYNQTCVVAINKFSTDTDEQLNELETLLKENNMKFELCDISKNNAMAGINLAKTVVKICQENKNKITFAYKNEATIRQKIMAVCKNIYGAKTVEFSDNAKQKLEQFSKHSDYGVVISKTPYSFSANPKLKGVPENFNIKINDLILYNGAKLIVAVCGDVLFLPALNKHPRCVDMQINASGEIL